MMLARQPCLNEPIPLQPGEVHLWLTFYNDVTDEQLHAAYREVLNAQEKAEEQRFYLAGDRLRYLITRALVRTVLSRYASVDAADWVFLTNAYGCPGIANAEAKNACLSFNISHTRSLIVLGIALQSSLGVDVENISSGAAPIDIARAFFAPEEVATLAALPPNQQGYRFFENWTFKEAYVKARGKGLSLPLDKFAFAFPRPCAVDFAIHPDLADDCARWRFWQFLPTPDYLVAVCAERVGTKVACPVVRVAVPWVQETTIAPVFVRSSQ